MSDLTVGLAIVGGVALAAVVAHGAWQARKAGPRRAVPAAELPVVAQMEPVLTDTASQVRATPPTMSRPTPRKTARAGR